jgi:hypothetical protein
MRRTSVRSAKGAFEPMVIVAVFYVRDRPCRILRNLKESSVWD